MLTMPTMTCPAEIVPAYRSSADSSDLRRAAFALDCGGLSLIMDLEGPQAVCQVLIPSTRQVISFASGSCDPTAATVA